MKYIKSPVTKVAGIFVPLKSNIFKEKGYEQIGRAQGDKFVASV